MDKETTALSSDESPAMGEWRARWGYGYQDKVATDRTLHCLRKELSKEAVGFEGIRLADLEAGKVDDFVLVWNYSVEGNSIKWSGAPDPLNWGELIGTSGLLKDLADGYERLRTRWPAKQVTVRLHTNRPPSEDRHHKQIVTSISVADFLKNYWSIGPTEKDSPEIAEVWKKIAIHTRKDDKTFRNFVASSEIALSQQEPPGKGNGSLDWHYFQKQFDRLKKAIATWLADHGSSDNFINKGYLLAEIGIQANHSGLIQHFPEPNLPYEWPERSANALRSKIAATPGGYLAVAGPAGIGKSTIVQKVLTNLAEQYLVPYYTFIPSVDGNRDRGEALTFFQDVVGRLDQLSPDRLSIGIADLPQGRDALRKHMAKASERYLREGQKTILLIDGLDHVQREVGLQASLLNELPAPAEVPNGFLIILSAQPQALRTTAIPRPVATAVRAAASRLEIAGLTREETFRLIGRIDNSINGEEKDSLFGASNGNPLILTYLLSHFEPREPRSIERAIRLAGQYTGDIQDYYLLHLAPELEVAETREILGLLCRAAPTIPTSWLQEWPEAAKVEDLYDHALSPFIRYEDGSLQFIHDSLVTFLKAETRTQLPGIEDIVVERKYNSNLADRCANRPCADPLGRARIQFLWRADRRLDLLNQLTSEWVRSGTQEFLPYFHIRPLLLLGLASAWKESSWGETLRLILLDYELSQRSSRIDAALLAKHLLDLDEPSLALAQIKAGGRLLVGEKEALNFARDLWEKGNNAEGLKREARSLYLQAKPISLIYDPKSSAKAYSKELQSTLAAWCQAAPFFEESPSIVAAEIDRLTVPQTDYDPPDSSDKAQEKASLHFLALTAAIKAGSPSEACRTFIDSIAGLGTPELHFQSLLLAARSGRIEIPVAELQILQAAIPLDLDMNLVYAWHLYRNGFTCEATEIAKTLRHIQIESYGSSHTWGFSDITYTVRLQQLQEMLEIPTIPWNKSNNEGNEANARARQAAYKIGHLSALASKHTPVPNLKNYFRDLLLFHNLPANYDSIDWRDGYILRALRSEIYKETIQLATLMGQGAIRVLKDTFVELSEGPAGPQFAPVHRRMFAEAFYHAGVISQEQATKLGLSTIADVEDEDPSERQEACFEIASFLNQVGDQSGAALWRRKAGDVSAGSWTRKDHHMAHLATWLSRSIDRVEAEELLILDEFARAIEVAGGDGQSDAAETELQFLVRAAPSRAWQFAVECIDRQLLRLSDATKALIMGGSEARASPALLQAIYCEMYSLTATEDVAEAALAVVRSFPRGKQLEVAKNLRSSVRTNSLPSRRWNVTFKLHDALAREGLGPLVLPTFPDFDLSTGVRRNQLYRISATQANSISEVAARLGESTSSRMWDPNPTENADFDWWEAIKRAHIRDVAHFDLLVTKFPPPDYRESEFLAIKAKVYWSSGDYAAGRRFIEEAIELSQSRTWHRWLDGAPKVAVFAALKGLDHAEGLARGRKQFAEDLEAGKLSSPHLLFDIEDIFEVLEVPWPAKSARSCLKDYLRKVLKGNRQVSSFQSLTGLASSWSADQSICRFLVHLMAFPGADIAVAARRTLGRYFSAGGNGLTELLFGSPSPEPLYLERILIAVHVGSRGRKLDNAQLRNFVESLNLSESLGVRSVAKRICQEQGWKWLDISSLPDEPVIVMIERAESAFEVSVALDRDVAKSWKCFFSFLSKFEQPGLDLQEIRSHFERNYGKIQEGYAWADMDYLKRWLRQAQVAHWLDLGRLIGRESALRLLGKRTLSGQLEQGWEASYDRIFPIYDPHLELQIPTERPAEFETLNWSLADRAERTTWKDGTSLDDWHNYPKMFESMHIIGERSLFVRPEWEWPREERHRGLATPRVGSSSKHWELMTTQPLTYADYLRGSEQGRHQIVIMNNERQLVGSVYGWVAINANRAKSLGWRPSDSMPFQWLDSSGSEMIRSCFWKDGWTWLEPPKPESLGEGWLVLAAPKALEAIRRDSPELLVHLWVERSTTSEDGPIVKNWHLSRNLDDW